MTASVKSAGVAAEDRDNWRGVGHAIVTACKCEWWLGHDKRSTGTSLGLPGSRTRECGKRARLIAGIEGLAEATGSGVTMHL